MGQDFSVSLKMIGSDVKRIAIGNSQHRGARPYQEDSFGYTPLDRASRDGFTAVVADGMGGLSAGDKVSSYAVSAMLEMRYQVQSMNPVPVRFRQMLSAINTEVCASGVGGGCTASAVFCCKEGIYWCSVGDSRIYIQRDGMLFQLTEDGDHQNDLLDEVISGELDFNEMMSDESKDSLAQYIGFKGELKPDVSVSPLIPQTGDRLLICSDGVYNALSVGEMSRALASSAHNAADALINGILQKNYPNQDNCTAVVLEFL